MIFRLHVRGAILVAAAITGLVTLASPARADRCDDSAKELSNQVDRLKVNFRAANVVYLTHPLAKELSVACRGDKYSIELYAKGDRKPKPEFFALVGSMAAIVFTVTKDDTTTGATRCLKRMGLLRGDKVTMGILRVTRAECPPEQAAMQKALIDMLHAAYLASVADGVLTLVSRQGARSTLEPLAW